MTSAPFATISADPPWLERGGGRIKRGADRHYPLMDTPAIKKLMLSVLTGCVARNAHLWLWVTDNFLLDGLSVMEFLGFRYVRTYAWIKTLESIDEEDDAAVDALGEEDLRQGLSQYARGSHELCLFGTCGRSMLPDKDKTPKSVIFAPRGRHSEKPDKAFSYWFERVSRGPRLEMFSRAGRPGWSTFGLEAPGGGDVRLGGRL